MMWSSHFSQSLIMLAFFTTCLDARLLDLISSVLKPHQQSSVIEARQQPGVIATDVFLRRAFHSAVVVGKYLYIDGGQFSYKNNGSTVFQYSDATLSLDLSKDFENATAVLQPTSKSSDVPNLNSGALWYHQSEGAVYGQFVGQSSSTSPDSDPKPPPLSVWSFKPDGSGSGQWSSTVASGSPALRSISRPNVALSANGPSSAWALGGTDNDGNLLPGMAEFSMVDKTFSNISASAAGGVHRSGVLHYVPVFGPGGIYLAMSGRDEEGHPIPFDVIPVFDPATRTWHNQTTTGNRPSGRVTFCTAGIASTNNTYEIFVYNGNAGNLGSLAVPYDTISILTLPAFQWISVPYNPQHPRHGHTCHAVGGSQILVVGGADSNGDQVYGDYDKIALAAMATPDQNKQGLAVFDLTGLKWQDHYSASAPTYVQSSAVQSHYGQNGQSYVQNLDPGVADLLKTTNFNATATNSSSSSNSTTAAAPTSTPSGTNTGAIVGGVVGGVTGLALIAGAAWFLLRRRKKNSQKYTYSPAAGQEDIYKGRYAPQNQQPGEDIPKPEGSIYRDGQWVSEVHNQSIGPAELDERSVHRRERTELPS